MRFGGFNVPNHCSPIYVPYTLMLPHPYPEPTLPLPYPGANKTPTLNPTETQHKPYPVETLRNGTDHSPHGSQLARIVASRFLTERRRFRFIARMDHSLRASQPAGLSPRGGGFGSWFSWIVDARITAGWFFAPTRRPPIIARADHSLRVPKIAGLSPREGGFRS